MKNKECFLMYKSFYEPTKFLSLEHKGLLYTAIMEYQANGTIIDLPADVKMAFNFFVNQFRLDNDKYVEKCNKAKESVSKRWNKDDTNEDNNSEKCESVETNTNVYERIQPNTNHTDNDNVLKKDISSLRSDISKEKKQTVSKKSKPEFIAPTLAEVIEYANERKRPDIAQKFFDYFVAGNWVDAKGDKVRNWKQKFITWENNNPAAKVQSGKPPEQSLFEKNLEATKKALEMMGAAQ